MKLPVTRSLAATMDAIATWVPAALVNRRAWQSVRALTARLPGSLADGFYLECRLTPSDSQVDWIVRLERAGLDIIAGRNNRLRLPAPFRADARWRRVASLCRLCTDDRLLRQVVSHLWLEFDLVSSRSERTQLPVPSIFVALNRGVVAEISLLTWSTLIERLLMGLGLGATQFIAPDVVRRLLGSAGAHPPIPYLGVMLGRAVPALRVYFVRGPRNSLRLTLRRMGWPGDDDALVASLANIEGAPSVAPRVGMLHVDVATALLPRLGVEYKFERRPQRTGVVAELSFLQRLEDLGLCTASKRAALLSWPGSSVHTLPHELWVSRLDRRVGHVKFLWDSVRRSEAKAYLLTQSRPVCNEGVA